jgi:hypothetical protein
MGDGKDHKNAVDFAGDEHERKTRAQEKVPKLKALNLRDHGPTLREPTCMSDRSFELVTEISRELGRFCSVALGCVSNFLER